MVIHARVPAEVGAVVLDGARRRTRATVCRHRVVEGGPAGPVHRLPSATNVDALHVMAESFLAIGPAARTGGDRYQIVVNVDEDVLTDDAPDGVCELDGGPRLAPETVRRLGCDASTVLLVRRKDGTILTATNKTQAIPRRVRRMVHARDKGCRFPGCGRRAFVDAHHIHHWAHGGSNELDNLVELCWFHHRLVHEGGWTLRFDGDGDVVVTNPVGNVIPSVVHLRGEARRRGAPESRRRDLRRPRPRSRPAGTAIPSTSATSPPRSGAPTSGRGPPRGHLN